MDRDTWDESGPSRVHGKSMEFHCSNFQYTENAKSGSFCVILGLIQSPLGMVTVTTMRRAGTSPGTPQQGSTHLTAGFPKGSAAGGVWSKDRNAALWEEVMVARQLLSLS